MTTTANFQERACSPEALEVLRQFRVIFGSMRQHFREIEAQCGVSGAQIWTLTEVRRSPGIGVSELATRMGTHQSTSSLMVEKLASRGLLNRVRDDKDQRRTRLFLSEAGKTLLSKAPVPAEGLLPQALNALPTVALDTLRINLDELIRQLARCDREFAFTPLANLAANDPDETA